MGSTTWAEPLLHPSLLSSMRGHGATGPWAHGPTGPRGHGPTGPRARPGPWPGRNFKKGSTKTEFVKQKCRGKFPALHGCVRLVARVWHIQFSHETKLWDIKIYEKRLKCLKNTPHRPSLLSAEAGIMYIYIYIYMQRCLLAGTPYGTFIRRSPGSLMWMNRQTVEAREKDRAS